ncbi:hypothetical protein M758_1G239200 [Ceratodon purpureus]|uniref:Neurochondrin n=1 Tax=Ceratodon purpureus TaxID=3225 RepID=A0A8T0JBQ8_CERPU|nr:hypothetical protein KC19_1G244400 [Ceratodon purpureus]KAG0631264.1 hypothetical protein M758_1G239200 [Ceratodon purpureus]
MDECLKLLQGANDEQRLVGLLLATKIVQGNDLHAVRRVFDAIGFPFLNRLLRTGTGQARASGADAVGQTDKGQQQAYLHLAISIISAFCRLPELAAMDENISKVSILVETLARKDDELAAGDCLECLLAIGSASDKGREALLQQKVLTTVVHRLSEAPPNANWTPLAVRLILFMFSTTGAAQEITECSQELATTVPIVARQLVVQQDASKFEALSLLHYFLASIYSTHIRLAIRNAYLSPDWHTNIRSGLGIIFNSRVGFEKRQLILEVTEALVEIVGEVWLLGPMVVPEDQKPVPLDRFFMLVVETVRIETSVLLNEVARKTFDSGGGETDQVAESAGKQQGLATYLALLEHIINVVVDQQDASGKLKESTMEIAVTALNDVVGLVLEFLEDAQENNITSGDLLLGTVRLVGRYLAETPLAHRNRVYKLLGFLLSVTREGQDGTLEAVPFMLPALSQITTELDGCRALVFCGGHKQIVRFVLVATESGGPESRLAIIDACDTLLNLLIKQKDGLGSALKVTDFLSALPSLANWAAHGKQVMECALAASLCTMVLGLTNENALAQYPGFGPAGLQAVFALILMNLERCQRAERLEEPAEEEDLWDITVSGWSQCMQRYPSFKNIIKASAWLQRFLGKRPMTATMEEVTTNPSLQMLLASIFAP